MARDIKNKIVVVTGGAEGIGLDIASKFLKSGASRVIILDINEEKGNEAVKTLTKTYGEKFDFMKCDVTKDLEEISKAIFDKYKTVDVLINNAGIVNEFNTKKTIDINVTAVIAWTFKFWEHMRTDKGGKGGTILNLASIYGFRVDPFLPIYKASKHAVLGFTRTFGHEYNFKRFGVRVLAICPGYTETKLVTFDIPDKELQKAFEEFLQRPDTPWQKADAVGDAAVEIFKIADSGAAWVIEGGKLSERVEKSQY